MLSSPTDTLSNRLGQYTYSRIGGSGVKLLGCGLEKSIDSPLPMLEDSVVLGDFALCVIRVPRVDFDRED